MTEYIIKWILLVVSLLGLAVSICCIKWHNELHKNVCEYMSSYCNILEQIDGLDIPTPFIATLTCKYLIRDIATRGDN